MPLRRYPIPQDEAAATFEQPFPRMLPVKYRGLLVGAAELETNEYIYYMSPDVDPNARVELETQVIPTGFRTDEAQDVHSKQKLVSLSLT